MLAEQVLTITTLITSSFSKISPLLTIIALAFAIWQTYLSIKQNKLSQRQSEQLSTVAGALSTKYIGPFPDYINDVALLLKNAKKEIKIICTVPMHGVFNNPDGWLKMKHSLEDAMSSKTPPKVFCVFSEKSERIRLQNMQYKEVQKNWDRWILDEKNKHKIEFLFQRFSDEQTEINFEALIDLLEKISDSELKSTYKLAEVYEVSHYIPLYLWIIDNSQAIFVLKTSYPNFQAEAFWTSDSRLIDSLSKIHKNYCEESES